MPSWRRGIEFNGERDRYRFDSENIHFLLTCKKGNFHQSTCNIPKDRSGNIITIGFFVRYMDNISKYVVKKLSIRLFCSFHTLLTLTDNIYRYAV